MNNSEESEHATLMTAGNTHMRLVAYWTERWDREEAVCVISKNSSPVH